MAVAVAFDPDNEAFFDEEDVIEDPNDALTVCGSLVIVFETFLDSSGAKGKCIALAHYSVKEYLISEHLSKWSPNYSVHPRSTITYMAKASIRCLTLAGVQEESEHGALDAFYPYCADVWIDLFSEVVSDVPLQELVLSFLTSASYSRYSQAHSAATRSSWFPFELRIRIDAQHSRILEESCLSSLPESESMTESRRPSPLYLASAKGWVCIVAHLIQQLPSGEAECYLRTGNPLHAAAERGNLALLELLIDSYGVRVDSVGVWHHTAIQAAAYGGYLAAVHLLLQRGADVNITGGELGSPLQAASIQGNLQIVDALLEAGVDVNARGGHYSSALQAAAAGMHHQIVRRLLDKGAKLNARRVKPGCRSMRLYGDKHGVACSRSALHWAAYNNDLHLLQILAENQHFNVDLRSGRGTPLTEAVANGNLPFIRALLQQYDADPSFWDSCAAINAVARLGWGAETDIVTEIAELLLNYGADVNARDIRGKTALHVCAGESGSKSIIPMLLRHGADVNQRDWYGRTLLNRLMDLAPSAGGEDDVAKHLLEHGADPNTADTKGLTPLHHARRSSVSLGSLESLIKHGASASAVDNRGQTPLHYVLGYRYWPERVALLIEAGADVDAIDDKGRTPLHHLIIGYRRIHAHNDEYVSRAIREFLTYNPSINYQDDMGRTALDCALALSMEQTVAVLFEHGALASGASRYDDNDLGRFEPKIFEDHEDLGWKYVLDLLSKKEISQRSLPAVLEEASL